MSINNISTYNYNNDVVRFKYLEKVDKTPEKHDKELKSNAENL